MNNLSAAHSLHAAQREDARRAILNAQNVRVMLAIAFPPERDMPGALATLRDVSRLQARLTTRRQAARLVMCRNNVRRNIGNGNRAFRRARALCK